MNSFKLAVFLSSVIFAGSVLAEQPIKHPNLKDAYQACINSIKHIQLAQKNNDNNGVFGGHAGNAEQLLQQAKREIELADEYRDAHEKKK